MRRSLTLLLLVTVIGAGIFYWHQGNSACRVPLEYRVGVIDEGFGIDRDTARNVVSEAESMWEDLTGRNLFTYDESAHFTVNFVFDERQELTNEEHTLREILDRKEELSESIKAEYDTLLARYQEIKDTFEHRRSEYEEDLADYNADVDRWNEEGGAPPDVYRELEEEKQELSAESDELAGLAEKLNGLVEQINNLGAKGNEVVDEYNEDVREYNDRFDHAYEFTQGDYQGDEINIYQFDNRTELRAVLAHEFGHALSLGHVNDSGAIMYYLMEEQVSAESLSEADLAEFSRVCGEDAEPWYNIVTNI